MTTNDIYNEPNFTGVVTEIFSKGITVSVDFFYEQPGDYLFTSRSKPLTYPTIHEKFAHILIYHKLILCMTAVTRLPPGSVILGHQRLFKIV